MSTYYVSAATGNDTDDGLSEGDAWLTIDKAMNTVAAGDVVWIKADGTYTEDPAIDTAGTNAAPIQLAGYTTTIGDRGRITLVGQITDSIATSIFYIIENFDIEKTVGSGVDITSDYITFKNCSFHDCGTFGATVDLYALFQECDFLDNGNDGCDCDDGAIFVACRFYRNGTSGVDCSGTLVLYNCVFFSQGGIAIDGAPANGALLAAFNCTVDGDGKDTNNGYFAVAGFASNHAIVNCVAYDCTTGMEWKAGQRSISMNNLLNSNTANYADNAGTWTGEQTGGPAFENEAALDYRPGDGSNLKNTGVDINDVEGNTAAMDIGALQEAAGAGGGLLMANKIGNKQG